MVLGVPSLSIAGTLGSEQIRSRYEKYQQILRAGGMQEAPARLVKQQEDPKIVLTINTEAIESAVQSNAETSTHGHKDCDAELQKGFDDQTHIKSIYPMLDLTFMKLVVKADNR